MLNLSEKLEPKDNCPWFLFYSILNGRDVNPSLSRKEIYGKKRSSEEAAKIVVERLKESGNIQDFISSISDNVSWYGRFSRWPRIYIIRSKKTKWSLDP
mgnify:CR=1 FL=1